MSGFSVIISNYHHKGNLLPCLHRALALAPVPGVLEVVFARHGEVLADDDRAMQALAASTPAFTLLPERYDNRAKALNACASVARGDVLLFLESHVLAPPSLAQAYSHALAAPGVDAVQGEFHSNEATDWVGEIENDLRSLARRRRSSRGLPADEFNVHSAAIRRAAFVAAGGFDERLPGIGEVLLFHRIDEAGRLAHMESPVVEHINHADWSAYLEALTDRGREVARLRTVSPVDARVLYPLAIVDRHEARLRHWRWLVGGVIDAGWLLTRAGCALARAVGLRQASRRLAPRLASFCLRRGFIRTFR